ncbi:hypothetical protein LTR85_007201 [Meristemomyces frigidus]|nr:hypothetical protein LTR85_007201 [Meristemomyces frigidus]
MAELPTPLCVVGPFSEHQATVIFLHGRGSSGKEFCEDFLIESQGSDRKTLPQRFPGIRWVLPSAPERYSTVFQEEMPEWFDIYSLSNPSQREELQVQGLRESIEQIHEVLKQEASVIGASKVVLAGISQGCATGLHALLSFDQALGGFIGTCGWCPFKTQLDQAADQQSASGRLNALDEFYATVLRLDTTKSSAPMSTPALISYALDDGTVEPQLSQQLAGTVERLGFPVQVKKYDDCGHWIKEPEGVDDMASFLEDVVGAAAPL